MFAPTVFLKFFRLCVGGDAHIAPLGTIEFALELRKIGFICRVDVGIDPYGPRCDCDIEKTPSGRLLPIRKHREERENGIASAVPFSHFSIDAVTFDISKTPIPL